MFFCYLLRPVMCSNDQLLCMCRGWNISMSFWVLGKHVNFTLNQDKDTQINKLIQLTSPLMTGHCIRARGCKGAAQHCKPFQEAGKLVILSSLLDLASGRWQPMLKTSSSSTNTSHNPSVGKILEARLAPWITPGSSFICCSRSMPDPLATATQLKFSWITDQLLMHSSKIQTTSSTGEKSMQGSLLSNIKDWVRGKNNNKKNKNQQKPFALLWPLFH